jgi:hypothetical protein
LYGHCEAKLERIRNMRSRTTLIYYTSSFVEGMSKTTYTVVRTTSILTRIETQKLPERK